MGQHLSVTIDVSPPDRECGAEACLLGHTLSPPSKSGTEVERKCSTRLSMTAGGGSISMKFLLL